MHARSMIRAVLIVGTSAVLPISSAAVAQSADTTTVRPTANLLVDGIPPIPSSLPRDVRRYTESRAATLADWHPVRREVLISTRFGNTPQLHRVANPLGARQQLTFFDEPVTDGQYEPRQGRYVVFTRDVGGNEFAQLYRYDVADGRVTLLTDGRRSQNGDVEFSTNGDRIAYGSTRRNGADRDLYVMNPRDSGSSRMLLQVSGGGWAVLDWSPDDRQLLVGEYLSVSQSRLYLVDVSTGRREELTPRSADTVSYGAALFSRDGRGIYLTSDQGSEFQRLAYMDLATRRITPLAPNLSWDVDELALSEDGGTIAFVTNEAGVSRLYLMDTRTRQARP